MDRMLDLVIKIARVLQDHPTVKEKLRLLEQRWGRECLTDSPSKLERLIQQCGGAETKQVAEFLVDVIDGIDILLNRGAIPGGAVKLTVGVLFSNRAKGQVGLVERLLKRKAFCRFLIEKFPLADRTQASIATKFTTYPDYHKTSRLSRTRV